MTDAVYAQVALSRASFAGARLCADEVEYDDFGGPRLVLEADNYTDLKEFVFALRQQLTYVEQDIQHCIDQEKS